MKQVVIKSIELRGLKASMIKAGTFYRVLVNDRTVVPVVDNCYVEFTQAYDEFDKIAECFGKGKKK